MNLKFGSSLYLGLRKTAADLAATWDESSAPSWVTMAFPEESALLGYTPPRAVLAAREQSNYLSSHTQRGKNTATDRQDNNRSEFAHAHMWTGPAQTLF